MTDELSCPVCLVAFKADDTCATDIELGMCHAECLDGSPVVDLDTGEETGGKVDTYLYSEVMDPPAPAENLRGSAKRAYFETELTRIIEEYEQRRDAILADPEAKARFLILRSFELTASEGSTDA